MVNPIVKLFFLPFLVIGLLFTSCGKQDMEKALSKINDQNLKDRIRFISNDTTAGRAPGSQGSMIAQHYIAGQMQQIGLKPGANDTSYYQQFDILKTDVQPGIKLVFSGHNKHLEPAYYEDYILFPGAQKEHIAVKNAELVFVGYGIQAPEFNWDDFKDSDVHGKILLIMNNDPDTGNPDFFGGKARLYYGRWNYKYEQAARMGAAGAIIIHTTESAAYPWKVVQASWSGSQFQLFEKNAPGFEYIGWITENIASRLAGISGYKLEELQSLATKPDFKPIPLGIKVNCTLDAKYKTITGTNILGILPGSDPELSKQAVIISAHHDHLGIGKAIMGDSIYNGAIDNASGVASILTLADAFSSMKKSPRRTLLFASVEGEESGLLGSDYYAQHPTFAPSTIAADVNIDFTNVWGRTRDVVLVGFGKSTIDEIVKRQAEKQGRIVVPEPKPERGSFYRSDQFSFAKIGVPGLYLSVGQDFIGKPEGWGENMLDEWIKTTYHQPSDEYDPGWDLSGQIEDLNLLFQTILELANNDDMPTWLPGTEFEKARQTASKK